MSGLPKITAIIPALNEEETISAVISNLLSHQVTGVIVVDNGSTDSTEQVATKAGATVIKESVKGYGKACLTGIANLPTDTEWVLFCDADGSDDLSQLPDFWPSLNQHDFIIGNRRATAEGRSNLTPVQNFGNWLSGFLMKLGWGKGFSDLGPLRLIRKNTLESLGMEDENFGWTVEMQAKALEKKVNCHEIPVGYLPRQGGTSKISGNFAASCKAGQIILTTIGRLWLERQNVQRLIFTLCGLLLITGAVIMGAQGDPAHATAITPFYAGATLMIIGYLLSFALKTMRAWPLITIAVITRLLLLPMPPGDDIWRYIWEGYIQNYGFNPYNTPPNSDELLHLRNDLWPTINHKDVTAIYPPLTQLLFRLTALISPSVLAFKILILAVDLALGALLWKRFSQKALLYLLNPMVIYCFTGGAHYEPLFLLPLAAAWLLWEKKENSPLLIGLLLGLSISLKLVAIIPAGFIGWQYLKGTWQKTSTFTLKTPLHYVGALVTPTILSFLIFSALSGTPETLLPEKFSATARSASLIPWIIEGFYQYPGVKEAVLEMPKIAAWLDTQNLGYIPNKYFGILFAIPAAIILLLSRSFSGFQGKCFQALLIFSPMVHAWYFTWLIPFAIQKHRITIIALSITGFLYFLLPYRQAAFGTWNLHPIERLLLWSPVIVASLWAVASTAHHAFQSQKA